MQLLIPIYVEVWPRSAGSPGGCRLRPLFGDGGQALERRAPTLSRGLEQLRALLGHHLQELGEQPNQRALGNWLAQPERFQAHALGLRLDGSRHAALLVSYQALERTLVFVPRWPQRHFELPPESSLEEVATRILGQWLRAAAVPGAPPGPELHDLVLPDGVRARLSALELEFKPPAGLPRKSARPHAGLGGTPGAQADGAQELRKVGRLLNDRFPHALDRALCREPELQQLDHLLAPRQRIAGRFDDGSKPMPVLLLGPRKVGKSCLLEEWLWQHLTQAPAHGQRPLQAWSLAPMRLISGMSYLGEWEERVLAILAHAERRGVLLVFDDLPGLFLAGRSSGSELTVGDLLLPWLEQRRVRVVASCTPDAWARLREQHRRFADLFQVLPLAPPDTTRTWQILAHLRRQLERQHAMQFSLDAVPTTHALCARFEREQAFPGNVASVLKRLAAQAAGPADAATASAPLVDRARVLDDYARSSGIAPAFLDASAVLAPADIAAALSRRLHGQPQAIAALTATLSRFKAGLNDPRKPLGVFLLVGPTGVGKTQCAKALAEVLSGSAQRLLRFDLNEYGQSGDVARLLGTPSRPDGLLTAAVRRQPCAVILFDEIEKAAPELHDLLLALLDEGRLSDALGRVADFTQTVILLTSNLGAREASTQLGFTSAQRDVAPSYREATRRFFRPEFFNRLDDVIAFAPFPEAELSRITASLVQSVLARPGLQERCCVLAVDPAVLPLLVRLGHDPALGARALKRGVERALAQPLARQLAAQAGRQPTLLRIIAGGDGTLKVQSHPLRPVATHAAPDADDLAALRSRLDTLATRIDRAAPAQQRIALEALDPATRHYFELREQQMRLSQQLQRWLPPPEVRRAARAPVARPTGLHQRSLSASAAAMDPLAWSQSALGEVMQTPFPALSAELAWLDHLASAVEQDNTVLIMEARYDGPDPTRAQAALDRWARLLEQLGEVLIGWSARRLPADGRGSLRMQLEGSAVGRVAALERGCWLLIEELGTLAVLDVRASGPAADHAVDEAPLLRLADARGLLDLRSGLELPHTAPAALAATWWLRASAVTPGATGVAELAP